MGDQKTVDQVSGNQEPRNGTPGAIIPGNLLPDYFQFSQSILQDFIDCRRRFQLRSILGIAWPALQSEPALESEQAMQKGAQFHHMVHQHLLGVPAERLALLIHDPDLERWWENYSIQDLVIHPSTPPWGISPEVSLSDALEAFRLVAKYDLIVSKGDGRFTIIDWKTSRQRPRRQWLADRMQSRVYPYLLVRAGAHLNQGQPIQPEGVEMVYWFAEFPTQPERFPYSDHQYREDRAYLSKLVQEISRLGERDFSLTTYERHCAYCSYRSLCDRGVRAGTLEGLDSELEADLGGGIDLDFEQIAEIEF